MIAVYVGKNEWWRSIYVLGSDMAQKIGGEVVTTVNKLKGADVVLNLVIEDIGLIELSRRYVGYGPQVMFFSSNTEEYNKYQLRAYLVWGVVVPFIVHSNHHYRKVTEAISFMSGAEQRKFRENLHFIWGGITDEFTPGEDNHPHNWLVPYNRINQGQKNIKTHAEISTKATLIGKQNHLEFEINFILPEGVDLGDYDGTYNRVNQPSDRAGYINLAQQHGVFLSTSNYESFGLMYLELLACGVVGVFLDRPWVRTLLPDYPFVADRESLPGMLLAVTKDYQKARDYVLKKTIPFIHEQRSLDRFCSEVKTVLENTHE